MNDVHCPIYQVPVEVAEHDELQVEKVGEREEVLDE